MSTTALGPETKEVEATSSTSPACTGQPSCTSLSSSTRSLIRVGDPSQGLDCHSLGCSHKYSRTRGQATGPYIVSFRKVIPSTQDKGSLRLSSNQGSISTDLGNQTRYCLKFPVAYYSGSPSPERNLAFEHPYPTRYLSLSTRRWSLSPSDAGFRNRGPKHYPYCPRILH